MVRFPAILFATLNLVFLGFCYQLTSWQPSADIDSKMNAVTLAMQAQTIIGPELIGEEYTPITTTLGAKEAKNLSLHPDFAAVAVDMLQAAGVQAGDKVAVNMSSSFPALNIAVLSAVKSIDATPILISSVGASTWGANRPEFTWLDMESKLNEAGLWPWRSSAVGIGGGNDQGQGLTPEGLALIQAAIERSGVTPLGGGTLEEAVNQRVALYKELNQGQLPKVLINVGGSHAFLGEQGHKMALRQGLTQGYHPYIADTGGLAAKFIMENRGVIHFININRLAAHYHIQAGKTGQSSVFYSLRVPSYLRAMIILWLAGGGLCLWYGKRQKWWKP